MQIQCNCKMQSQNAETLCKNINSFRLHLIDPLQSSLHKLRNNNNCKGQKPLSTLAPLGFAQ